MGEGVMWRVIRLGDWDGSHFAWFGAVFGVLLVLFFWLGRWVEDISLFGQVR